MPEPAKQRLVEILARKEIPLIEDDINAELFHHEGSRARAAQSYDRAGLVLLCGSISKTLAPGYRVGWVAAPGRFYEAIKTLKLTTTLATATLPQLAVAEFLAHGGYDYHLRSLRRRMATQMAQMAEAVATSFPAGTRLTRPTGGFVLWLELPPKVSALELHARALQERIAIAPGPMFSPKQQFPNFIRLSCGHPWSLATERAVALLGRLTQHLLA
jgi:DNA-binding transcriptional MocR family regulator